MKYGKIWAYMSMFALFCVLFALLIGFFNGKPDIQTCSYLFASACFAYCFHLEARIRELEQKLKDENK